MEKILSSKQLYQDKIFTVNELKIDLGNGQIVDFERVESTPDTGDGVLIVALDQQNNTYLVEEYQLGAEKRLLVLPRGGQDGLDLTKRANQELQEEVGFKANQLTRLTEFDIFPGWFKGKSYLYLAQDLEKSPQPGDEKQDIIVHQIKFDQVIQMIFDGQITDARTIAGLLYVKEYLNL